MKCCHSNIRGFIIISVAIILLWFIAQIYPRNLPLNDMYIYFFVSESFPISSPDDITRLTFRINDAGATSTIPFYAWVEKRSWLTGKKIISSGWVEESTHAPQVEWLPSDHLKIYYEDGTKIVNYH